VADETEVVIDASVLDEASVVVGRPVSDTELLDTISVVVETSEEEMLLLVATSLVVEGTADEQLTLLGVDPGTFVSVPWRIAHWLLSPRLVPRVRKPMLLPLNNLHEVDALVRAYDTARQAEVAMQRATQLSASSATVF
jgi:hypothetical protein